ncbi:hypothetical protein QR680_012320 [Steinernema hermaphroditum]|uniref:RING-type E3 ubiquitin transferase n=1 Tax=Steinernema hermaphroditum TaxID=289476 RepID=A0AA39I3Z5_9BILA|nr:hypothetical protein QR680_012320 [Steinernema hermaphroditum]
MATIAAAVDFPKASNGDATADVDVIFADSLPEVLQCPICSQALRIPMRFACGHAVCQGCIPQMKSKKCPKCENEVEVSTAQLDKGLQKSVQMLKVKCSFVANGCDWIGVLKDLQKHVTSCELRDIVCPRGCGDFFPKNKAEEHFAMECSRKMVICEDCLKEVSLKGLEVHKKVCPMVLTSCPNQCGLENHSREEVNVHLPTCPRAGSSCPFAEFGCTYMGGRELLQQHLKEEPIRHLSLLCDGVLELKSLVSHMHLNMEKMIRNMEKLQAKSDILEKLYGAQLVWRIDNIHLKQNEARSGTRTTIFSQPFMSGRHGYKLVASVALYGDGPYRGKYLSCFIAIMKGEYDPLLAWPFVHKTTFTLMDQNPVVEERNHVIFVAQPQPTAENKSYLSRPVGERNASFGAQKFCPLDILDGYVRDDTLFIKINIDTDRMVVL